MKPKIKRPGAGERGAEKPLLVVAALIAFEGRILACQRHRADAFGLKWEFPGGKVRAHEKPPEALVRELEEELGVAADIGDEVHRTKHRYATMAREIELIFFIARADGSSVQNRVFEQIRWVAPENLASLDFLPADRELIRLLSSGKLKIS
ncbi:MAG: (deoxy)nucleoside triphosphate pyrophosphohydrolase [Candidatus Acidiferrales bacterium]|jgi:8-oxo-dGTP diphosphatase